MHSDAEFHWLHTQNAFRSRMSLSHIHLEVNHADHMKCGIKYNYAILTWNYMELHNKIYIYVIKNVVT